jgi:ABC-type phosphate transport system, periplasmic component
MYMENSGTYIEWKRTTDGRAMAYCAIGKSDIAVISRGLKEEEISAYKDVQSTLLCTEALAVVAGADCPVNDITIDQLAQIFNGDITEWTELGGSGAITVYAISDGAPAGDAFEALVLGVDENGDQITLDSTVASIVSTPADMGELIANNSLSIGFMPLSLVDDYNVKVLDVEGISATKTVVKSGRYPLSRSYYIATVGVVSGEAQSFIEYCTTDGEAQVYLKEQGYILP